MMRKPFDSGEISAVSRVHKHGIFLVYIAVTLLTLPRLVLSQEAGTVAQTPENKIAVAAYVTGGATDYQKEFVGAYLLNAIVSSETNVSDENAAAFLDAVSEEQSKRQNTLDDSLICEIGRKSGIRYVCAVVVTPALAGPFTISGRVISTKTGGSRFHGEAAGPQITMGALALASDMVLEKMFGGKRAFGGQTAPEPIRTAPMPPPKHEPVPAPRSEPLPPADTAAGNKASEQNRVPPPQREIVSAPRSELSPDAGTPEPVIKPYSARVKNVAVVETEIDAQSGASAELTSADARLVTAELRREAVKNLPRGKYNVMTSETVYAQGSAVLEECADENCVIVLGSAIGADYIVRGIISKIQTRFTLSVEIYETENGNLVASSEPLRTESLGELIEKAAAVCADMYKTFLNTQTPPPEPAAPVTPQTQIVVQEPDTPLWKLHKMGIDISIGAGGLIAGGYDGGIEWGSGERVTMPYSAGGAYLFLDAVYAEMFLSYYVGDGKWESPNVPNPQDLPNMPRSYVNIGVFAKYPFDIATGALKFFPLLGLDYEASISGKIRYSNGNGEYTMDGANGRPNANALSSLWLKIGGGIDVALGKTLYLRSEAAYGLRAANAFEYYCVEKLPAADDVSAKSGQGFVFKFGVGIKL